MLVREFLNEVENMYSEYFNGSRCRAELNTNLGASICISCYLAADKSELSNGYWENDMINVRFWIHDMPKGISQDDEMPEKCTLENSEKSFNIKPENNWMYCSRKVVAFRKVANTPEKILVSLDKFFNKLSAEIKQSYNSGETMDQYNELICNRLV